MGAALRNPRAWIFGLCLLPLLRLILLGMGAGLGANPIEFVTRSTGTWTLVGLLVTLAITPLRRLTGRAGLVRYRRMLAACRTSLPRPVKFALPHSTHS